MMYLVQLEKGSNDDYEVTSLFVSSNIVYVQEYIKRGNDLIDKKQNLYKRFEGKHGEFDMDNYEELYLRYSEIMRLRKFIYCEIEVR